MFWAPRGRLWSVKTPTRLTRAIAELKAAAVGRPFVLVMEKAHAVAPRTSVTLYSGDDMAVWQVLGLLQEGGMRARAAWRDPGEQDNLLL